MIPEPLTQLSPISGQYFIDEFKNGTLIRKIAINQNRIVFGRVPDCDIIMEHPSISRYHAALLWSPKNDIDYDNGTNIESYWYLVDCGSTHGTTCNKLPVEAGKMIKVSLNNNIIRFGGSTRFYSLASSQQEDHDEDQDEVREFQNSSKNIQDDSCSWGMNAADAYEDDTDNYNADSQALKSIIASLKCEKRNSTTSIDSENKASYLDNPYKSLQHWFMREGYDFDLKVLEDSNKHKCIIELPIDGQFIPIEGNEFTKKKDAIKDCCMKTCSILDQAQLLFPWQQRQKAERAKKNRKLDGDDDNDDDNGDMIDETANQKKRKRFNEDVVETYESLQDKWKIVGEELAKLKIRLTTVGLESQGLRSEIPENINDSVGGDSLDDFMNKISSNNTGGGKMFGLTMNQKIEKSNIRMQIKQMEIEQRRLERLIKIAAPVSTLSLSSKHVPKSQANVVEMLATSHDDGEPVENEIEKSMKIALTTTDNADADIDVTASSITEEHRGSDTSLSRQNKLTFQSEILNSSCSLDNSQKSHDTNNERFKNENVITNENLNKIDAKLMQRKQSDINSKISKSQAKELRKLKQESIIQSIEHEKQTERKRKIEEQLESQEDFIEWAPPTGQSGDGKTHLNAKFGY